MFSIQFLYVGSLDIILDARYDMVIHLGCRPIPGTYERRASYSKTSWNHCYFFLYLPGLGRLLLLIGMFGVIRVVPNEQKKNSRFVTFEHDEISRFMTFHS